MQAMNVHEAAKSHGADTHRLPSRFFAAFAVFAAFADIIQERKRPQIDADYTD